MPLADRSKIEWTDASWTPIRARNLATGKVGWHCEHATTGCEFCYAEGMNKRLGTGLPFKPGHRKDIEIVLDETMLLAPLRWKNPRMIFVCSMTDLFADFVTDEWIDNIFAVMALCPQHTFQVLTKRPERMLRYLSDTCLPGMDVCLRVAYAAARYEQYAEFTAADLRSRWPLKNVLAGTSAERQHEADDRRAPLRALAERGWLTFVSYEPALGMVDWTGWEFLRWLISGGESGAKARPSHPDWHRAARDWCQRNNVAYFFKQWGEWLGITEMRRRSDGGGPGFGAYDHCSYDQHHQAIRVGKKSAGCLLDGIEHKNFPPALAA